MENKLMYGGHMRTATPSILQCGINNNNNNNNKKKKKIWRGKWNL